MVEMVKLENEFKVDEQDQRGRSTGVFWVEQDS